MIRRIFIVLAVLLVALAIFIALRPDTFRMSRSTLIAAPREKVFAQVADYHRWNDWSPWAKLDFNCKYSFEGAPSGKGAIFKWAGNKDVGAGQQEILECSAPNRIIIRLEFTEPFAGTSMTEFKFEPEAGGTRVTWIMSGHNDFLAKAMSLVMDCEKMVGPDFEKGLANMKSLVEGKP